MVGAAIGLRNMLSSLCGLGLGHSLQSNMWNSQKRSPDQASTHHEVRNRLGQRSIFHYHLIHHSLIYCRI